MQGLTDIGIQDTNGYACTILLQEGIPISKLKNINEGISKGIKVFIWNKQDKIFKNQNLLKDDIVVITDNFFLSSILKIKPNKLNSSYFKIENNLFEPRSFVIEMSSAFIDAESFGNCYDDANNFIDNSGIIIKKIGKITFISYPWNFINHEVGSKWDYRPCYSEKTQKHFVEIAPCIDYGAFRRLFFESLCYSFSILDAGFIRIKPKFGRFFSVRIDADGFSPESTDSVIKIANKINAKFTWFIDVEGWGPNLNCINKLAEHNQEVQLHCYEHVTYISESMNYINLKKGSDFLTKAGFKPLSLVSPFGFNFKGFRNAIKKLRFNYSSEFGYSVDDLPSFPLNNTSFPLQIPVHSGSIGVFNNSDFTKEQIFEHLEYVIDKQIQADGIAIIYDHPVNRMEKYENEFSDLFKKLSDKNYNYINMTDYYDLWIHRSELLNQFTENPKEFINDKVHKQFLEAFGSENFIKEAKKFDIKSGEKIAVKDMYEYPPTESIESASNNSDLFISRKLVKISISKYFYNKIKKYLRKR